jgi:HEXXH motif-containing protein
VTFDDGKMWVERPGRADAVDLAALAQGAEHEWLSRPYRTVRGAVLLALADNNPLSAFEAHPEKTAANAVNLGGRGENEWIASIRTALAVIEQHLPGTSQDIDVLLQQIVPTGFDAARHLSCSYREDLGTIYVSLHPSVMTMAEALIHEVSHNKLNALFELDPVIENGTEELYASPVRPDPRPLHGVLLAVHAFVPVACLYERTIAQHAASPLGKHLESGLEARLEAVLQANRAGMEVLRAHARPTPIGRGLLDELSRWERHFRGRG